MKLRKYLIVILTVNLFTLLIKVSAQNKLSLQKNEAHQVANVSEEDLEETLLLSNFLSVISNIAQVLINPHNITKQKEGVINALQGICNMAKIMIFDTQTRKSKSTLTLAIITICQQFPDYTKR